MACMAQALRHEIAGMYERLGADDITVLAPEEGAKNLWAYVRKLFGGCGTASKKMPSFAHPGPLLKTHCCCKQPLPSHSPTPCMSLPCNARPAVTWDSSHLQSSSPQPTPLHPLVLVSSILSHSPEPCRSVPSNARPDVTWGSIHPHSPSFAHPLQPP